MAVDKNRSRRREPPHFIKMCRDVRHGDMQILDRIGRRNLAEGAFVGFTDVE